MYLKHFSTHTRLVKNIFANFPIKYLEKLITPDIE